MMEINMKIAISFVIMIIMLRWAWKFLNWVWINPKKLEKRLKMEGLKGSSYKFLLGDMKEMNTMLKEANSKPINFTNDYFSRSFPLYTKLMKQYGKNCYMWLGPKPAIFITEPELIREVLSKSNIYLKIKGNPIAKLLAKGLASYEADKWAKHRRIINPAFHLDKLKHMLPSFYLSSCDMIKEWDNIVSSEGSSEVDVWPFLQTLTSDAISRTAFGSNSEEGRQIFELQKEQVYLSLQATRWIYIPGWRFVPTKRNKRIQQITNEVRSLVLGIINKRIREMKEGEATKNDLLGILLESNFNEIQNHGHKNFGMTIDDVIEECKLFYLAGQETTSVLLVWTLILLSKHLDWQEKARQEVHQVFGSNKPTYDLLNQLKVVTMILNEVLRLYPPGILLVRRLEKETKLGNLSLPGGILLVLPKLLLQHDNELWGDDAKEFNPQRFSEGVNKATKGKFAYFPFSWGPRICIGLNFALLEAKMALSMILQHYSFELSPSYAHAPCTIITLIPQHGAPLILRKLSKVKSVSD